MGPSSTFFLTLGLFFFLGSTETKVASDKLTQRDVKQHLETSLNENVPIYTKIYFFNCTNAPQVMEEPGQVKPLLKQVGPYTFSEVREKVNITFNSNFTVSYQQKRIWHFVPEISSGHLDDEIFTLNMVAVMAAESTRFPGHFSPTDYPFMRAMIDMTIPQSNETLFIKARVGNLTFDGIESPMLHMGDIGGDFGDMISSELPFDRFGWFYGRNGSASWDDRFEVFTGEEDAAKEGKVSGWRGRSNLGDLFPAPCDSLGGSAGDVFPPDQDKSPISYFLPDLCRPVRFTFKEEVEVSGLPAFRYQVEEGFLANATFNPSNSCFNPQPDLLVDLPNDCTSKFSCGDGSPNFHPIVGTRNMDLPNGLLNLTSCKAHFPAYFSQPHFYLAAPALLEQFHPASDLRPTESEHASHISLMPDQGIILELAIRVQINILYRPFTGFEIDLFEDVAPTFYPAIWFETVVSLPEDNKSS